MKKALWFLLSGLVFGNLPVLADCPSEDVTGDCFVDLEDFAVLSSQWLNNLADFEPLVSQWLTGNRLPEDMVIIPAGTFRMGNSTNTVEGSNEELPVHTVTLNSFAMGKYDITNEQYCAFLNFALEKGWIVVSNGQVHTTAPGPSFPYCDTASVSVPTSQIAYSGGQFSVRTKVGRDMSKDPMVQVSWYGAAAYCNWRSQQEGKEPCYNLSTWACDFTKKGYRLPTEAEWEYAARGKLSGKRFPWGDTITHSLANYSSSSSYSYDTSLTRGYHPTWNDGIIPYTSPVGSFSPNDYGLYDMAGNISGWCNDWYSLTYYSSSPQSNPPGPTTGSARVLRGGSWYTQAYACRVSVRIGHTPDARTYRSGFRLVLDL